MKLPRALKKSVMWGALALTGTITANQVLYWTNEYYHRQHPSTLREEFQKHFHAPLLGWHEDIESKPSRISTLTEVLAREQYEMPFEIKSIRIRSDRLIAQPFWDQIDDILTSDSWGYLHNGWLVVSENAQDFSIHHEIKHVKANAIAQKHPEFIPAWEDISSTTDASLYYGKSHSFLLSLSVSKSIAKDSQTCTMLGFVSDYARRNVHEDIAETCKMAETDPKSFIPHLFELPNERLKQKIDLAEQYGLIPAEFTDYVNLLRLQEQPQQYLEASKEFITNNPTSIYLADIHSFRGRILAKTHARKAIAEFQGVLDAPFKTPKYYQGALYQLEIIASARQDSATAQIYSQAQDEYVRRYSQGIVDLTEKGVSDLLQKEAGLGGQPNP